MAIPAEAIQFNGHRYQLIDVGMTWEEAQAYCQSVGGHLVTITSQEEQNFIESLLSYGTKNNYWLGGFKGDTGQWQWITGETPVYSNWASNQPDNTNGLENALMIYKGINPVNPNQPGQWNDLNSNGTCGTETFFGTENFGFVCEWDTLPETYVDPATALINSLGGSTYDFVFLFDISGSMNSHIERVKEIAGNFAAQLQSSGITNYRFAVGEFGELDEIYAYPFANGAYFTNDINEFTAAAAQAADKASNGHADEYGLTAIHEAIYNLGFNPLAQKRFIVLTDEGYEEDNYSDSDSVDYATILGELGATGIVVDVIGKTDSNCQDEWEPLAVATGGKFYDIYGDYNFIFQNIALESAGIDTSQPAIPIFGDSSLTGRIMFAQWGYGFTPPDTSPLFTGIVPMTTSADLATNFGSPSLAQITPANFAVTPENLAAQNFLAAQAAQITQATQIAQAAAIQAAAANRLNF